MVKKDFARNEVTLVRHNAVKAGSKLPKTTRMLNRWTVMSFTKSHERLLLRQLADPKIRKLTMLNGTSTQYPAASTVVFFDRRRLAEGDNEGG